MEGFQQEILAKMAEAITWFNANVGSAVWDILVYLLLIVGIFFTLSTVFVQFRLFPASLCEMWDGRKEREHMHDHTITPFQAFTTGLASRVGIGNIAGVAIAIASGGPGAVFWMWVTALIGMSSAFAESSLAQLFKLRDPDGSFRGGPAYYMKKGLRAPWMGVLFAIFLIFTFGFAFEAVQSNSIVESMHAAWGWEGQWIGLALVILSAAIIFGGVKRIGQVAESLVPIMAIIYLIVAVYILAVNYDRIPEMISLIVKDAFNFNSVAGGLFGSLFTKGMINGIKRGLFSNEAGMGSAPNTAASADVKHPVSQGLVQMLGVFVDTIVVCTCTAVIILLSDVYKNPGDAKGVALTAMALQHHIGHWGIHFLTIVIFLFAYSSVIGNYAYAESNIRYIWNNKYFVWLFRIAVLVFVYFGAIQKQQLIWDFADSVMAFMAVTNLIAIALLAPLVFVMMKDYQQQRKEGKKDPEFKIANYPQLVKRGVDPDIWK